MPPGEERDDIISAMIRKVADDCPWVFESVPVAYTLKHRWLSNLFPHEFSFGAWKYLSVDPEARERAVKDFRPVRYQ